MVERNDPARTGVKAGRVVGLLTAAVTVAHLVRAPDPFREALTTLSALLGVESTLAVSVAFWGSILLAASARYALCYVVGSLVGVVYDWLDRPPLSVLTGIVFVVGAVDGFLAAITTLSVAVGVAHLLAWLCYVPVFSRLFDADAGDARTGPRRLS